MESHEDRTPVKPSRPTEWSGKSEVATLIIAGLLIAVTGGAAAYAAWPAQEISSSVFGSGGVKETGSAVWALIATVVALIGQVMTAIGVIAAGVRLGNRD